MNCHGLFDLFFGLTDEIWVISAVHGKVFAILWCPQTKIRAQHIERGTDVWIGGAVGAPMAQRRRFRGVFSGSLAILNGIKQFVELCFSPLEPPFGTTMLFLAEQNKIIQIVCDFAIREKRGYGQMIYKELQRRFELGFVIDFFGRFIIYDTKLPVLILLNLVDETIKNNAGPIGDFKRKFNGNGCPFRVVFFIRKGAEKGLQFFPITGA